MWWHKSRARFCLKQRPEIIRHKTSPAKDAQPGGKFVNLGESTCLNMKLLGQKYFMNIHEGGLAGSSLRACRPACARNPLTYSVYSWWNNDVIRFIVTIKDHFMNCTNKKPHHCLYCPLSFTLKLHILWCLTVDWKTHSDCSHICFS